MAKVSNQKSKLLYLMKIFWEKTDEEHPITINELIEELAKAGISAERKSLYRDIEILQNFGLDIIAERRKTYGYYLASRIFELAELKLLIDAVQSSKFITHKKSNELIRKIESLSSEHEANRLQGQVYVANRIKNANESIYYNVDRIHSAIGENSKISFKYFDRTINKDKQFRHDGAKYTVSPWALTWDDENYYLIAYETETDMVKHYRVDKMMYIDAVHEKRDGRKKFAEFDMALYSKKFFGMFNGSEETVTIRCDNSLAGVIIDRFGKDITLFPDDENHFKVNINIAVSPMFFGWVFNFGDKMTIISPRGVINKFKEMAQSVIDSYE